MQTSKIYRAIETGKLMFPDLTPQANIDLVEVGQVTRPARVGTGIRADRAERGRRLYM